MLLKFKGGPGSGFHGHKGRPGEVGGSSSVDFFHTDYAQKTSRNHKHIIQNKIINYLYPDESVDSYIADTEMHMKNILDKSHIAIRTTGSALESILINGEIRSVFETKSSSAPAHKTGKNKYLQLRKDFEQEVFDIDPKQKSGRPVYGFITQTEDGKAGSSWLDGYGDVAIYMNDDVKNRSTFTDGDSLDDAYTKLMIPSVGESFGKALPSPVNEPSVHSTIWIANHFDARAMYKEADESGAGTVHPDGSLYWEAQIHGGITLSNISKIVFTKYPPSTSVTSRLNDLGIPWYIVEN